MVNNLKELEKLFKLCRKQGITELDLGTIKFKVGDLPYEAGKDAEQGEMPTENPYANFPDGELTPEQLAFYSAGGDPDEDPFRKDS